MTKNEIRKDLKEIRYYYSRKDVFEQASKTIGASRFENTIKKYNEAICQAVQNYTNYIIRSTWMITH